MSLIRLSVFSRSDTGGFGQKPKQTEILERQNFDVKTEYSMIWKKRISWEGSDRKVVEETQSFVLISKRLGMR